MTQLCGVFAENALDLYRHGLCVIPIGTDREPCVKGFQTWRRRPGLRALTKWIAQHGDSNIAIVPGLSNVIVADGDDAGEDAEVEELLGMTPLCVLTCRGRHRYYRQLDVALPANLRKFGLNVDLKAGRSIVIAPPSVHETGHVYRLEDCDWSALKHIPAPNLDALRDLIAQTEPSLVMRDGSRGQWLNDQLCRHAMHCATVDELMDVARELISQLQASGIPPLADALIIKRVKKVWRDAKAGKLRTFDDFRGTVKSSVSELDSLCRRSSKHGPDALTLLLKLRAEHSARCRRGQTFCLTPRSMAEHGVIFGWTRERIEKAREVLLDEGLIVMVSPYRRKGGAWEAAQYALAEFQDKVRGAGG